MDDTITIMRFDGDHEELWPLLRLNTGMRQDESLRWMNEIEEGRGTRYFVAVQDGEYVGFLGLRLPRTAEVAGLEPPEIIDLAVVAALRRRGIGRALVGRAVEETRAAGQGVLWVSTGGDSIDNLTFYTACGFGLSAIVPDGWGPGYPKAILRMELSDLPEGD